MQSSGSVLDCKTNQTNHTKAGIDETMVSRRALIVIGITGLIAGCSAESYKEAADRQVYGILKDRKEVTLGYQPEAVAETNIKADPPKKAFAVLPMTPKPPPVIPPMEPLRAMVPFGRLSPTPQQSFGPQPVIPSEASTQPSSPTGAFGIVEAEHRAIEKLSLAPPGPAQQALRFDLFGAIRYGVQHGRDYETAMEDLYLATLDVTLQRHLFEPRPFATGGLNYTGGQKDISYRSALTATGNVGVRQQLPYGGEIVAQGLVKFVDALQGNVTNGETAQAALSGSIPLLRGAGLVNLEPLIESERRLVYQVRTFEDFRRQFAINVASQYFNLVAAQKSVINRRVNYNNLLILTEQTESVYNAGRINFLGVQRSLQAQLAAESSLVDAQTQYQTSIDDFKILLGVPIEQNLDISAEELNVTAPDLEKEDPAQLALRYRLDLKTAEDQIEDARRGTLVAKNGLLPDVSLVAQAQVGNTPNSRINNLDNRTGTYSAGINVDLPVDRVVERNVYRRSLITLERAGRNYNGLRDQVILDVRDSVRAIHSAETSLAILRRSIDLAQRRLEYSYELLKQGAVDSRDVVESQQSLISAQDGYERALSNLQVNILRFLRNTGTLRVDPTAGTLGFSMDRAANREIESKLPKVPIEIQKISEVAPNK
jgi:outer membrane protein TolC